jgi:hypothetical protein
MHIHIILILLQAGITITVILTALEFTVTYVGKQSEMSHGWLNEQVPTISNNDTKQHSTHYFDLCRG